MKDKVVKVKNPLANAGRCERHGFSSWVGKMPWRKAWQATPVFLPGESHGQRRRAGCRPQGCTEADMIEVTGQCSTTVVIIT